MSEEKLSDTFPYFDDITVAGRNPFKHDQNVSASSEVVKRIHLTLNNSKSVVSSSTINVLGMSDHCQWYHQA